MSKKRNREEKFMLAALRQAKKGLKEGEVPIGAVVVYENKVVAKGYNRRLKKQLASAHAEMMAIDGACRKFHSWRLPEGCELYVTLEPCPMCMGGGAERARGQTVFRREGAEGAFADGRTGGGESFKPYDGSARRGTGRGVFGDSDGIFHRVAGAAEDGERRKGGATEKTCRKRTNFTKLRRKS